MPYLAQLPPYGVARDVAILTAISAGRLDPPTWVRVTMGRVALDVSADYLTIEGEHVPMSAPVAQAAVGALDALLPTPAIVDAIERAATIIPLPVWSPPAGQDRAAQITSPVLALCEERTRRAFEDRRIEPGQLVAGHRKDVVLAPFMPDGRVVIYGARWTDGRRLQPVFPVSPGTGHEAGYADYSHGIRAVRDACLLDGEPTTLTAILQTPELALLVGGPVAHLRYPSPVIAAPPSRPSAAAISAQPTLRRGTQGAAVVRLQVALGRAGHPVAPDGYFGSQTEGAVRDFQGAEGLTVDGVVGKDTWAALDRAADGVPSTVPDTSRLLLPLSDVERVAVFGSFEWVPAPRPDEPGAIRILGGWARDNIVTVEVPQLRAVPGTVSGRITCHRDAAPSILRFFAAVEAAGKLSLVKSFDGCWNPRMVRGGTTLSNHSFGVDFDLNAKWNVRGTRGARQGEYGSVVELYPIAAECNIGSGLGWTVPDPMHFGVRQKG